MLLKLEGFVLFDCLRRPALTVPAGAFQIVYIRGRRGEVNCLKFGPFLGGFDFSIESLSLSLGSVIPRQEFVLQIRILEEFAG
jgi:hypothetical protein